MSLSKPEKLLAVGLDMQAAAGLAAKGWTVTKLKRAKKAKLEILNLDQKVQKALQRPPIPINVLFKVLHSSKRTCCVCRNSSVPIVVHHINEWHLSRDHSETNLVVLCLNHHGQAHSTSTLSQNLSIDMIRKHKAEWERQVRVSDAKAIIGLSCVDYANWDYINLTRVFRLADELDINVGTMARFEDLKERGLITDTGDVHNRIYSPARPRISLYLCGLSEGRALYAYTSETMKAVVRKLGVVDISNATSFSDLRMQAEDGTLVFIQAPFYFRRTSSIRTGPGQMRVGYTKLGGVKVEFAFDAWESTSSSAHCVRLTGHKVVSVFGLVSGANSEASSPTLQISCLGMGSDFERIHFRSSPMLRNNQCLGEEEEEFLTEGP